MKRKFSLFLNVAMLALCVCAIAIGVYSAKQASLNVTGSIGFKAHNCDVDITAYIYGHAQNDDPLGEPVLKANKVSLNGGSVLQITGADKTLSFGSRYFSDMGESGEVEPIYIELTITNKSKFEVLLEDLTTIAENSSYTAVCSNPLHVLYINTENNEETTTLTYTLLPAKDGSGNYVNIETPVSVTLSMSFSKINTDVVASTANGWGIDDSKKITAVPTIEQNNGSDTLIVPAKFDNSGTIVDVVSIGNYGLLSNYSKVVFLKGISTIGDGAPLIASNNLNAVYLPSSINTINENAFYQCNSLSSITIPEGVTSIGRAAFSGCTSLTSITIPEGVTSISDAAFADCTSLTSITVDQDNANYKSEGNALLTKDGKTLVVGCKTTIIPEGVTSIGDYAFWGCSSLSSVTIPSSVTSIGCDAFKCCDSLTSITIPEGVTSIGKYAFESCTSLTSVTFGNTTGWYVGSSAGAKTTEINSGDLENTSTAATLLISTYRYRFWTRDA